MSVRDFELFHGAVLTKIVRSDRPIALSMFEKDVNEAWAAYTVNSEVTLYMKHSKKPSNRKSEAGAQVWSFTFSPEHLNQLQELRKNREVHLTLVCGQRDLDAGTMHVCFIKHAELGEYINISAVKSQTIYVKYKPRNKLCVWGNVNTSKNFKWISSSRFDDWKIPGS